MSRFQVLEFIKTFLMSLPIVDVKYLFSLTSVDKSESEADESTCGTWDF